MAHRRAAWNLLQVTFRYVQRFGNPPLTRTGYYYLPTGWRNKALPVMLMFHGLAGFGGIGGGAGGMGIMGSGSIITYQVRRLPLKPGRLKTLRIHRLPPVVLDVCPKPSHICEWLGGRR